MTHKHMTAEGDRSGVSTPSKEEKAHNKLKAIIMHLQVVDRDWAGVSPLLRMVALSEARYGLADVVTMLSVPE